jgi:hypothetical protein
MSLLRNLPETSVIAKMALLSAIAGAVGYLAAGVTGAAQYGAVTLTVLVVAGWIHATTQKYTGSKS